MQGKTYTVCLLMMATIVTIVVTVIALPSPFCKSGCDRPTYDACGECELIEPELFGQQGCTMMPTVVLSYKGQCQPATGPQMEQWLKKTWWDCNNDNHSDCECWTWYLRPKIPPPLVKIFVILNN